MAGPVRYNADTYIHPIDGILQVIVEAGELGCICILVEGVLEELQVQIGHVTMQRVHVCKRAVGKNSGRQPQHTQTHKHTYTYIHKHTKHFKKATEVFAVVICNTVLVETTRDSLISEKGQKYKRDFAIKQTHKKKSLRTRHSTASNIILL